MRLLDDDGRLLGLLNPIDAAVVFVLVVAVAVGATVALPSDDRGDPHIMQVQFEADSVQSYVIMSTNVGPVPSNNDVLAVLNKSSSPSPNRSESNMQIWTRDRVQVHEGLYYLNGERIFVGKTVTLDLGNVVIDATVTRIVNESGR